MIDEENESDDEFGEDYEEKSQPSTTISYHSEDFISKPKVSEDGTIPFNILEFDHSFGYDCRRRFNLCVADPDTLIFASGNLIHFFNVARNTLTFRRCSTGGGIGHITKNPTFDHIAIGENGVNPPIIIYEWPSMEIVTVLHEGTTRSFSYLRYSPDGLQLVSQGGDPDYLITVWDWQHSKIALQCKSHGQDVFNVVFSPTMEGRMTSCGAGHIKCWKMSKTFTGLKLQGELGRFGKTEISDIVGVYPMADEKIISGSEWGNILVWNEGLIKIEVCRKNGRPCHESYISQFEFINGELISVGTDGYINVWYYETIDQAEPTEDSHFIEVEPVYEFSITGPTDGSNSSLSNRRAMLMQILKQNPNDADSTFWYAQDGNGGIWRIELSTMQTPKFSEKLLTCHAGPIADMDAADWGPYTVTIGQDGCLHAYNYQEKRLLLTYQFHDVGSCVVWLPCSVEPSGKTLVCGFRSGVVRMVSIDLGSIEKKDDKVAWLRQVVKPHTKNITRMTINPSNSVLVTGSEDSTIFAFYIEASESHPNLVPIGYVEVPSSVTFLTWKPNHPFTIFVGCSEGDCVQVDLPEKPQDYTTISYKLTHCQPIVFKFESVKSSILREQARLEIEQRRQERIAEKREELRIFKENNPGADVDEELFLEADMEEEVSLPELYVPEVPNPVLVVFYTANDTVVLSMAGYDAGYVYEYSNPEFNKETLLLRSNYVADCDDKEIRSYLFYNDRKYVIFGMENGEIRLCKVNPDDEIDFSDYWILPMHDNFNGYIPSMRLSYDRKMLLTCGHDGNIFSFTINDDSPVPIVEIPKVETDTSVPTTDVADIEELDYPSLEQVIVQAEENRIMANAKDEKQKTLAILRDLTEEYNLILKRNQSLPTSQRLTEEELELDPRITEDLNEQLKAEMDLVHRKLAYNVEKSKLKLKKLMDHFIEPITGLPFAVTRILEPDTMVYSLRELKLTGDYALERGQKALDVTNLCDDENVQVEEQKSASAIESVRTKELTEYNEEERPEGPSVIGLESFLKGLSPRTIQFHLGDEINQMLKKYRALKAKLEEQEEEWKTLQSLKPDPKAVNPEDEEAIEHAKNTIGDYKLKAALNLDDNVEKRPTVLSKYKQIINCRRKIHFRREDYNDKLRDLRMKKVELEKEVEELTKKLRNIHTELPNEWVKELPDLPDINYDIEFPEKNLEMESYTSTEDRVREMKKRRRSSVALHVNVEDFDEEYEVLLLDESRFRQARVSHLGENEARRFSDELKTVQCTVPEDVIAALEEAEKTSTKLEHEMKRVRAARKNHEQGQILSYIQRSYEAFDEELNELERERLEIIHESVYMDLYLLTMHQELIVLKRFESMENELSQKVDDTWKTKTSVTNKITKVKSRIDEKTAYITKLQERIRDSTMRYLNSVAEDKYYIFFKKICKKKYKPPKRDDASSSSESSSSESSSDDDDADGGASEDSRDLAMMHMDEAVCPEGCDRELYDQAFAVRERRYDAELKIRDEQRSIELLQKELEALRKRLRVIEGELVGDKEKLEAFLREKQRQLNDIDVTVVLKMHQLQCFAEGGKAEKIQNCIVFDKSKLSQLYARVGELQQETADQVAKHKNDKIHLHKMKADCEAMKKELESLKAEIKKEMQQKFGQQVSLVTLYEAILRRLIYDIKANTGSLIKFYDEKIKIVKSEYKQQLQILKNLIEDNTEKLSFLTVLEEELLRLRKTLNTKIVSEEEINKIETQYESDLHRLKIMWKNQEKQKEFVSNDIRALCNRSRNLVPLDQLKSKADKAGRRATMTLFGGKEKDLLKYQILDCSKDDVSTSNEGKEFLIDDVDYYKKIIAIRHLLSQVTTVDETNTRATIAKMLQEVTENLQRAGYCQEEIEKNLSDIINVSHEEHEYVQDLSKDSIDSLSDMIYRYSTELREAAFVQEIKQEVRERLDDLFLSIGIQDETGHMMHGLVSKLKTSGNVGSGLKYLLENLPLDTDEETKAALRKHIKHTLLKVIKHIEIEGVESIEIKEEDFE